METYSQSNFQLQSLALENYNAEFERRRDKLENPFDIVRERHAAIEAKADFSGSSDCTLCKLEIPCEKVCRTCLSHDVAMCAALNLTLNFVALQIFAISKRLRSGNLCSPLPSILKSPKAPNPRPQAINRGCGISFFCGFSFY